jgi:DNA-binding MarR family transcriptional regulator
VRDIISKLNKQFENRVRLGIMSVLMVNESIDFNSLKELLDVTDGNLASHIAALEKNELIEVQKQFIGRKPNTTYRISVSGRKAFTEHLEVLEIMVRRTQG